MKYIHCETFDHYKDTAVYGIRTVRQLKADWKSITGNLFSKHTNKLEYSKFTVDSSDTEDYFGFTAVRYTNVRNCCNVFLQFSAVQSETDQAAELYKFQEPGCWKFK